jgi:hypothetical protein
MILQLNQQLKISDKNSSCQEGYGLYIQKLVLASAKQNFAYYLGHLHEVL